jgi:hypothetical protein
LSLLDSICLPTPPRPFHSVPRVDDTLLRRIMFLRPATGSGQFPPPSFVVGMEELASIPDAKAHNRYACL